jgi:hypothetical protein
MTPAGILPCVAVAAHEILHLAGMIANSSRVSGIGPQHYVAYPGEMKAEPTTGCAEGCDVTALTASALSLEEQFD